MRFWWRRGSLPIGEGYEAQIANVVDNVVLYDLMGLAGIHARATKCVPSPSELLTLHDWLNAPLSGDR